MILRKLRWKWTTTIFNGTYIVFLQMDVFPLFSFAGCTSKNLRITYLSLNDATHVSRDVKVDLEIRSQVAVKPRPCWKAIRDSIAIQCVTSIQSIINITKTKFQLNWHYFYCNYFIWLLKFEKHMAGCFLKQQSNSLVVPPKRKNILIL